MNADGRTQQRRSEVIDAALHIIATRGIAALSLTSVATTAQLDDASLARQFPSLEALLDAVAKRIEELLQETYPEDELPPVQRLAHFIELRSAAVGERLGIVRLVTSEQFLLALPKAAAKRLTNCVQETRSYITQCLREGQERGEIRSDLEPAALAPVVMGAVLAVAMANATTRTRTADGRRMSDAVLALLAP